MPGDAGLDGYGEVPGLAGFCEAIGGGGGGEGVFRRRRSKNNNTPKNTNPTTPPRAVPAIAPLMAAERGYRDTRSVDASVGVVRNVVVLPAGREVDLVSVVDSGPPAH